MYLQRTYISRHGDGLIIHKNLLWLSTKKLLFSLVLYFSLCSGIWAAEQKWHLLAEFEISEASPRVIFVNNTSTLSQVRLKVDDVVLETQDALLERGTSAIFYLPKQTTGLVLLEIHRIYKVSTEQTSNIRKVIIKNDNDEIIYKTLSKALSLWQLKDQVAQENAVNILENLIRTNKVGFNEPWTYLVQSYLWMLNEFEKTDECKNVASTFLKSANASAILKNTHLEAIWSIRWAQWRCENHNLPFTQNDSDINLLLQQISETENISLAWQLNREQIRSELANSEIIKGIIQKNLKGMEKGREELEFAIQRVKNIGEEQLLAQFFNMISPYYIENGSYEKGEKLLLESIELHRKAGKSKRLADSLNNLVRLYKRMGVRGSAIDHILEAIEIEEEYPIRTEKGFLFLQLAQIFSDLGNDKIAMLHFTSAKQIFSNKSNNYGVAQAQLGEGVSLRNLGLLDESIKIHLQALAYFNDEQEEVFVRYALLAKMELLRSSLLTREQVFLTESTEISYLESIEKGIEDNLVSSEKMRRIIFLAEYYLTKNNVSKFLDYRNRVVDLFLNIPITSLREERLDFGKLSMLYLKDTRQFQELDIEIKSIQDLIWSIRSQIDTIYLGPIWSKKSEEVLSVYIDYLVEQAIETGSFSAFEKLFIFLEKNSALSLRTNISRAGMTNSHEQKLVRETKFSEIEAMNANDENSRGYALQKVAKRRLKIKSLGVDKPKPIKFVNDLSEVQAKLFEDELLLRIYVGEKKTIALYLTNSTWNLRLLPGRKELEQYISFTLQESADRSIISKPWSQKLSDLLGLTLIDWNEINRLILIPSEGFHGVPFNALNISKTNNYLPLAKLTNVIRTHSVSDYLSDIDSSSDSDDSIDIAIFADPIFDQSNLVNFSSKAFIQEKAYRNWTDNLYRLRGTAEEARSIQQLFEDKTVITALGNKATTDALLSKEMRTAKLLHIASHGYFSVETPGVVGIATTKTSEKDSGLVTLTELYNYNFHSNLVVISGCETQLGVNNNSEGFDGLAKGFLSKGAGSVIGTLWSISDKPTAKFMGLFYKFLKLNGGNASEALNKTRQLFIKSGPYKHPFFWSGFILTSANRAYETNVFR